MQELVQICDLQVSKCLDVQVSQTQTVAEGPFLLLEAMHLFLIASCYY